MEFNFETRQEASAAAARRIATRLETKLQAQGRASLVVSGGTTPGLCFAELSGMAMDWANVHVLMSDERWVPADHDDSNEKLVRTTLLQKYAADAQLLPIYKAGTDIEERCEELDSTIRLRPFPFACVLLGMGEDGHFASLFPDAQNLQEGLNSDGSRLCLPIHTAASPHARVSLTLAAISRSDEVVLLIFGEEKRRVYEQAKSSGNTFPVACLLKQKRAPVSVYWAP